MRIELFGITKAEPNGKFEVRLVIWPVGEKLAIPVNVLVFWTEGQETASWRVRIFGFYEFTVEQEAKCREFAAVALSLREYIPIEVHYVRL